MTSLSEQVAYLRLSPLTPIHVGTGDTLDPLSYVMREDDGVPRLYPIDLPAWVEAHENPAELARIFATSELPEIRRHVAAKLDPLIFGGAPATVHSRKIYEKYAHELGARDSRNQLLIDPAIANGRTGALIVPGSSIKGAIRTAVIDWIDREWGMDLKAASDSEKHGQRRAYANKLEEYLGKISDNAFKNLKVGDFQAPLGDSLFVTANEVRIRPKDKPPTPKHDCQVTLSLAMTGKPYALYGKVTIGSHDARGRDAALTVAHDPRRQSWSLVELMALCRSFYGIRYIQEKQRFYSKPHLSATAKALAPVDAAIAETASEGMLVRIGHYSHVECMTVSKNAPQTRKAKDGGQLPFGTTRTLADHTYPFGWAVLRQCSEEEYRAAEARREAHDAAFLRERQNKRQIILDQKAEEERARGEEQAREEKERLAREAELAALEAMTPLERLVHLVESDKAHENQAVDLFGMLQEMEADMRVRAAAALKAYWVRGGKKWIKKECSDKQWKKVVEVKRILGES